MRRYWEDMTAGMAAALPPDTVAVLPVASIEQHGPHLPLSTDAVICRGILARAVDLAPDGLPLAVLPLMPLGHAPEHTAFAGTLSLPAELLLRLWKEVARQVHRAGVRRLVLFNAHGGNPPVMDILAMELRAELGMLVVPAGWMRLGLPDGVVEEDELAWGIHGGLVETSVMLHLRPDLVRDDRAQAWRSEATRIAAENRLLRAYGRIGMGWMAQDLNPAGVVGDAAAADAETGRALVEHAAARLVELLGEVRRFPVERFGR
ncbi:MAG TPA: creatininase family protein [Azospirillaceae bacterium]|nr:creatininase family protein [Azospirillaceae bacterium]